MRDLEVHSSIGISGTSRIAVVITLLSFSAAAGLAQTAGSGEISGTVTDPG